MNRRAAKRKITLDLAEAAREVADLYADPGDGKLSLIPAADRARLSRAAAELAHELAARYDPDLREPKPDPVDPNQIELFEREVS